MSHDWLKIAADITKPERDAETLMLAALMAVRDDWRGNTSGNGLIRHETYRMVCNAINAVLEPKDAA